MNLLVRIESFPNLPLAEFAQLQLKDAGIASCLGNSTLVAWFWQLGFAVGGIKLFVKQVDAAQAREILELPEIEAPQSPEYCPRCHEPLLPGWSTCWRCEPLSPIEPTDSAIAFNPSEDASDQMLLSVAAAAIGLTTFMACGPIWFLVVVGGMGLAHLLFEFAGVETHVSHVEEPKPDVEDAQPTRRRNELVEDMAVRAWRASIFGLLFFPPLAVLSIWLAGRISSRKIPLSAAGRRRRLAALTVGVVGFAVLLFCIAATFGVAYFVYDWMYSRGSSPWSLEHQNLRP